MKTDKYQDRFYRDWVKRQDLCLARITVKETDLQILTDKPLKKDFVQERVRIYRGEIEDYIGKDRRFLTALKPLEVELSARPIIREMSRAARLGGVGPMAAVAGAIAQFLGRDLFRKGYKDIIIENGGDIFLRTRKACRIGIYAGNSRLFKGLGLRIYPQDTPMGVCTSSGTVGHSLSFGLADAAVILASRPSLADAVATATANRVRSKRDLEKAADFAQSIKGVFGGVVIVKNNLVSWGKVELVV